MRGKFSNWGEPTAAVACVLFLMLFALLPVARLAIELVLGLLGDQRAAMVGALQSSSTLTASWHSIEVAVVGALIASIYGLVVASLVTLTNVRYRNWIVYAFVVQAMLPPQVVALAWLQIWSPLRGLLQSMGWENAAAFGNPLQGRAGIMALLGIHYAPLVFLTVRAGLLNVPAEVIEAARVSGARPRVVLLRVIWPLVTPALAAGAALAFVSCIGNFGIPAFLGIPANYLVLPTLIYRELSGFGSSAIPTATMLSLVVSVLAGLGILVQHWFANKGHFKVTPSRAADPPFLLHRARVWVEVALLTLLLVLLLAPLAALLAKSLSPAPGVPLTWASATMDHYVYVLKGNDATVRAFVNSIAMSMGAAAVLATVALFMAYLMEYRKNRWLKRLDYLIEVPYVLPGVVLSIAMILLYLKPVFGISLYNTLGIIFLAYLARFLAIQLRPIIGGFQQLPVEMLEAAEVFGAPLLRRLRTIVIPLLLPSVTAGAMLVVLLALNELTISALLWSSGAETLGVAVFNLEQGGESAAAAAIGIVSVAVANSIMLLASIAGRRLPSGVLPWRA
ncbi:MAG: iron ABC transporter permease [Rhodoferax sp.]|nr:iron ABC transporter permease [Rhodoferax sp.]MBP9927984.1 iron ABC transporter permease [Rhodoferax sp.]HQX57931.1 iron ABC transporter permease [Burkholderiaceae bacterium]HQZ04698.1 iron ABC transporter permease [Burkholderiaceae bacterium]HRA60971.1 iron ABC transporter permease [Burkholderiaceae bacterium]